MSREILGNTVSGWLIASGGVLLALGVVTVTVSVILLRKQRHAEVGE